jgi:hypothetical protein
MAPHDVSVDSLLRTSLQNIRIDGLEDYLVHDNRELRAQIYEFFKVGCSIGARIRASRSRTICSASMREMSDKAYNEA